MRLTRSALALLMPAALVYGVLLVLPLATIFNESFKAFTPGRIGSAPDAPYTFMNYRELLAPAYLEFLWTTFKLGLIVAILALTIAFPIAHFVARQHSRVMRRLFLGLLITMMFLSALVRVYSLELTFGPVGILRPALRLLGIDPNSGTYLEATVVAGLLHFVIPLSALMLIGTIQNINPRLVEAAQALGAARWKAHLTITLPLSLQGLLSAFLISFTIGISAFVVPWVLGKGRVLFISNLVYSRFSEVANYPSGSAVSVVMLLVSLAVVFLITRLAAHRGAT